MSFNTAGLAARLSPLDTGGSGELKKLKIKYERKTGSEGKVEALFNPTSISRSSSADWDAEPLVGHGGPEGVVPKVLFNAISPETLSLDLFFDTYEARPDGIGWARAALPPVPGNVVSTRTASDVREHTDQVALLGQIDSELHRPPVCTLWWGDFHVFRGVLTSLSQNFTMFLENGTPVRATLSCSFTEVVSDATVQRAELHSADVPRTRRVTRTDTLHSIAAEEYGDPALWREIARTNGVINPLGVRAGDVLVIPRLQGGGR